MKTLKPGEAPGLEEIRPARDGTRRWRWNPAPKKRARGFRSVILYGLPGTAIDAKGWQGLGFDAPPPGVCVTTDGPPMALEAAMETARALAAASTAQNVTVKSAPRPAPPQITNDMIMDEFLARARAGRITRRGKGGQRTPISPRTVEGYDTALRPGRAIIGPSPARQTSRAEVKALCEALIEQGKHHTAVAFQRAWSRCVNTLREDPAWAPALPPVEAYSQLGLGQPGGRARMATPEEAEAMFRAFADPAGLAAELHARGDGVNDIPPPRPGAAAMWLFALWTIQRGNDVVAYHDGAFHEEEGKDGGLRLYWTQSKTGTRIDIPLLKPARQALQLARAARAGSGYDGPLLLIDTDCRQPYRQVKANGRVYYKRFNTHWNAARALAGRLVPSLTGTTTDRYGDAIPALRFADARDTGVTRLFEAMQGQDGALVAISRWHGSDVETLIKLLKNYLDASPAFANRAGKALERHARDLGIAI